MAARTRHLGAEGFLPPKPTLPAMRESVQRCEGCDLFRDTTQAVFGAGDPGARVVLVGEQPGDAEDRRGEPFVGPAGKLLDQAVAAAGIDPATVYTTNAVKHFRFRGTTTKRRIHATPDRGHVVACRPWLVEELRSVRPEVVVALGASAAKALFGTSFKVTEARGTLMPWPECADVPDDFIGGGAQPRSWALATLHPSAALRADDRRAVLDGIVSDLAVVARAL